MDPLPDVTVTVTVMRAHPLRERAARFAANVHAHRRGVAAAAVLIGAAIVMTSLQLIAIGGSRPGRSYSSLRAAYPYPSRGLVVTISTADPSYARADVTRSSGCARYCGYDGAIFHRAGGSWRLVLKTGSYSCPVAALPRRVQTDLDVCALR
jgi:hypothetical protein